MGDLHYLNLIRQNYQDYLEAWEHQNFISLPGEDSNPYPRVHSAKNDSSIYIGEMETGIEDLFFSTYYDSIPEPHEMSTDLLERLPVELVKILRIQASIDNFQYWSHTYEILSHLFSDSSSPLNHGTWHRIETLFNLILCRNMGSGMGHCSRVLSDTVYIASFVAYPALEGYLCDQIDSIKLDGIVNTSGRIRRYSSSGSQYYSKNERCSSLTDLLIHYEEEVSSPQLREEIKQFRENIAIFGEYGPDRVYKMISQWRNSVVHAEEFAHIQSELILTLLSMFLWNTVNEA